MVALDRAPCVVCYAYAISCCARFIIKQATRMPTPFYFITFTRLRLLFFSILIYFASAKKSFVPFVAFSPFEQFMRTNKHNYCMRGEKKAIDNVPDHTHTYDMLYDMSFTFDFVAQNI